MWEELHIKMRLLFTTRGYPHATILTIQPQRARSSKLIYTEFWILYHWAARLCEDIRYNCDKTLPVSLRYSTVMLKPTKAVSSDSYHYAVGRCVSSRPFSAPVSFAIYIQDRWTRGAKKSAGRSISETTTISVTRHHPWPSQRK